LDVQRAAKLFIFIFQSLKSHQAITLFDPHGFWVEFNLVMVFVCMKEEKAIDRMEFG
jgi:hypothetical protein